MSKEEIIFVIVLVSLIFILVGWVLWDSKVSFKEDYKFYSEWCPKLNAEIVEPIDGYVWQRSCLKEDNGTITKYFITKINGEYYLQERT